MVIGPVGEKTHCCQIMIKWQSQNEISHLDNGFRLDGDRANSTNYNSCRSLEQPKQISDSTGSNKKILESKFYINPRWVFDCCSLIILLWCFHEQPPAMQWRTQNISLHLLRCQYYHWISATNYLFLGTPSKFPWALAAKPGNKDTTIKSSGALLRQLKIMTW